MKKYIKDNWLWIEIILLVALILIGLLITKTVNNL